MAEAKTAVPARSAIIIPFPLRRIRRRKAASFSDDWTAGMHFGLSMATDMQQSGLLRKRGVR